MTTNIITGDCIEIMDGLDSNSFDLIFADPPYNIGVDYGDGYGADMRELDDYVEWTEAWMSECEKLLTYYGSLWILINTKYSHVVEHAITKGFLERNKIIWRETFNQYTESNFANGYRNLYYVTKNDCIFYWFPDAIRIPSKRNESGDKRGNPKGRVPDNVWDVHRLNGNDPERVDWHPCQLRQWPLERIMKACLPPSSEQVCNVLDPFCGSGTTGIVAKKLGHNFVGIEKNPEYASKAEQRIDAYAVQQEMFERLK